MPALDTLELHCQDDIMLFTHYCHKDEQEEVTLVTKIQLTILHQQRENYFAKVTTKEVIHKTHDVVCDTWNTTTSLEVGINIVKWSRFARKMKFTSSTKKSNHDIYVMFTLILFAS